MKPWIKSSFQAQSSPQEMGSIRWAGTSSPTDSRVQWARHVVSASQPSMMYRMMWPLKESEWTNSTRPKVHWERRTQISSSFQCRMDKKDSKQLKMSPRMLTTFLTQTTRTIISLTQINSWTHQRNLSSACTFSLRRMSVEDSQLHPPVQEGSHR